jgi:hypothetical protein
MRVGWVDMDGDNLIRLDDDVVGYRFWYQTSTGRWAEKRNTAPSQYTPCLTALDDPEGYVWSAWHNGQYYYDFCTSDAWYWAVDIPQY